MEAELIDFIGTDTHRDQHIEKIESITIQKKISYSLKKVIENTKEVFTF